MVAHAAPVADPYGSKSSSAGTDAKKQEVLLGRISMMVPKSLLVSLSLSLNGTLIHFHPIERFSWGSKSLLDW